MIFWFFLYFLYFLYCGEANVYQENLDSFLAIAEELKLKGLMGKPDREEELVIPTNPCWFQTRIVIELHCAALSCLA